MTVASLLRDAVSSLRSSTTPRLDAEVLLAHVLEVDRSGLLARRTDRPNRRAVATFRRLVARRAEGVPVAYLVGRGWFYGLELRVSPAVLVPRPETEMLVDWALARLRPPKHRSRVVDVGTGSGAVAIAIALAAPDARVHATDISAAALRVARANAARIIGGGVVTFHHADLLPRSPKRFDLVVANLPYVAEDAGEALDPAVAANEPAVALFGGPDGLAVLRRLLSALPGRLAVDGAVAVEIGWRQGPAVTALAAAAFPAADVALLRDLAGHDRLVAIVPRRL